MSSSKRIIFSLSLLTFLGASAALICKECNVNCESPVDELCLEPGEGQEVACLTESFKDTNDITLYQRKCVLYKKDTKFECADYPQYSTISCTTCKTDRCNGASSRVDDGKVALNATAANNTTRLPLNATVTNN